jgi:hypothetical protein
MSKHEVTVLRDDVDDCEDATTVEFEIEGEWFELDLCDENAKRLRKALERFEADLEKARAKREESIKDFRGALERIAAEEEDASREERERNPGGLVDARDVRAWAARNGIAVAPRGPISSTIIDQYRAHVEDRRRGGKV